MGKELKLEYAIAVGAGPFPFDMLRYDHCFPASESYSGEMGRDHYNHERVVIVARYRPQPGHWTVDRWKSFGWELITYNDTDIGFDRFEEAKGAADKVLKECKEA